MNRVALAEQIAPIMKDDALVPVNNGQVELREPNVMTVVLAGLPVGSTVINMRKIGRLSGIRDGRWNRSCDYLLVCRTAVGDEAVFVELKRTLSGRQKGMEQLRWSLPYLEYLRTLCRIEYGASRARMQARYVMIGERPSSRLAKQRVSGGHALPKVRHEGITIQRLVGSRLRFSWLKGD